MKKWIALTLALLLVISLAACGGKTTDGGSAAAPAKTEAPAQTEAPTATEAPAETAAPTEAPTAEPTQAPEETTVPGDVSDIEVEKDKDTVTITVPADFADTTDDEGNPTDPTFTGEEGIISVTQNEDGSVTYVMTREKHEEIMRDFADAIDESIEELLHGEDGLSSVTKVEHDVDYASFKMFVDPEQATGWESFYALVLCMSGATYQAYAGNGSVDVPVEIIDSTTKEVTDTVTYAEWIELMSGLLTGGGEDWEWEPEELPYILPEVEPTVLLDDGDVVVTLTGLDQDYFGGIMNFEIVNNSEAEVVVDCNQLIVNDFACATGLYATVPAGETKEDYLYLPSDTLTKFGTGYIGKLELQLVVYDSESYDTLTEGDLVEIRTSDYGEDWAAVPEGEVIFEQDGVLIVYLGQEYDETWDTPYYQYSFYVENNSDKYIGVDCSNFLINGNEMYTWMYMTVPAGKRGYDFASFSGEDFAEYGFEFPETIEVSFTVSDEDEWEELFETGPITIDLGVG